MTEMVSQVTDEERNVVWLMRNNIPLIEERLEGEMRKCYRRSQGPLIQSPPIAPNKSFPEHLCSRHHLRHSVCVASGKSHSTELQLVVPFYR